MSNLEYVRTSLEVNLFYQRIMKEHLFFLQANLQPVENKYIEKAITMKKQFEQLLNKTLKFANGIISECSIMSNEFVTQYTLNAEEITSKLTGISIDTEITKQEENLMSDKIYYNNPHLLEFIDNLNNTSLCLVNETISFQKELISQSSNCKIFISVYPQMLDHDTREAEHYSEILKGLLNYKSKEKTLCDELNFWNTIMAEHAKFIDGMLDPTELSLKRTAENIAEEFEELINECIYGNEGQILQNSLNSVEEIQLFKTRATQGLLSCKIKSIIPPLLADHVLREANHYLKLLKAGEC